MEEMITAVNQAKNAAYNDCIEVIGKNLDNISKDELFKIFTEFVKCINPQAQLLEEVVCDSKDNDLIETYVHTIHNHVGTINSISDYVYSKSNQNIEPSENEKLFK